MSGKIALAITCLEASNDLGGLLLIYTSLGKKDKIEALAIKAEESTKFNISFICYFTLVLFRVS